MSLQLDARQRAMLQEMGVRVVWPEAPQQAEPDAPASTVPVVNAAPPVRAAEARAIAPGSRPPAPAALSPAAAAGPWDGVGTMTLEQLRQAVDARAAALGVRPVFGVGDPRPAWLVVGEPPTEEEEQAGEPFAGDAGRLLDNMLAAAGLSRSRGAYLTSIIKHRLPGERNPRPQELAEWEPVLQRQLQLLQPRVVIGAGRFAMQLLARSAEPPGKLRGRVLAYEGVPLVVTYHPSYLLRNTGDKARAWADLCLALQLLQQD